MLVNADEYLSPGRFFKNLIFDLNIFATSKIEKLSLFEIE
jgi:hypothetical protein